MNSRRLRKSFICLMALLALLAFGCGRASDPNGPPPDSPVGNPGGSGEPGNGTPAKPGPTVKVTARTDLRELEPKVLGEVAEWPEGPVTLRFRFSAQVDGKSVMTTLEQAWAAAGKPEQSGLPNTLPATLEEVTWHIPDLPPLLEIDFSQMKSSEGAPVTGSLQVRAKSVYQLGQVDLASPKSPAELVKLPPEVQWGSMSQNGAHLALAHLKYTGSQWRVVLSVLSREGGQRRELGAAYHWDWLPDGRLLVYDSVLGSTADKWSLYDPGTGQAAELERKISGAPVLSPDGKWVAGLVKSEGAPRSLDLAIAQADGSDRRSFEAVAAVGPAGPKGGDGGRWVAWAPDMSAIYTLDPTGAGIKPVALVRVDLQTGEVKQLAEQVAYEPESHHLFPSPDGRWLLVDQVLVSLTDGSTRTLPDGARVTTAIWSPNSQKALIGYEERLWVLDIEANRATALGAGVPLGVQGNTGFMAIWPEDLPRTGWRP